MRNSQRGFISLIILAIIAVVAIGGGAYYYSQNKAEMKPTSTEANQQDTKTVESKEIDTTPKDWKTYSSAKTTFSFRYPSEWTIDREFSNSQGGYSVDEIDFNNISSDIRVNVRRMSIATVKQSDKTYTTLGAWVAVQESKTEGTYNPANYSKGINGTTYYVIKHGMGNDSSLTAGQSQYISVVKEQGDYLILVTGYYKVGLNPDETMLSIAQSIKSTPAIPMNTTSIQTSVKTVTPTPVDNTLEIRSALSSIRAVAELSYDTNHEYSQICSGNQINTSSDAQIKAVANNVMLKKNASSQSAAGIQCVSTPKAYAVSVALDASTAWCVDSTGNTKIGTIDRNTVTCK